MASLEQSVRARDLLYVVLRSWRQVLISAMVVALLTSSLIFLKKGLSLSQGKEPGRVELTKKEQDAVIKGLYEEDSQLIRLDSERESLENKADTLKNRLTTSALLAIDDKAQPIINITVDVNPEEPLEGAEDTWEQRHYHLMLNFSKISKSETFLKHLQKATLPAIPLSRLTELVDSQLDDDMVLHYSITAPERDAVYNMAEAAKVFFQREIRERISVPYLYEILVVEDPIKIVQNPAIREERERLEGDLAYTLYELEEIEGEIENLISGALEEKRLEKEELLEGSEVPTSPLVRSLKKYLLPALILGALLASVIAVYRAISRALIFSAEDLAFKLGLFYLGGLYLTADSIDRPSPGKRLDAWLEFQLYLRGRGGETSIEDQLSYIGATIEGIWESFSDGSAEEGSEGHPYIALIGQLDEELAIDIKDYFEGGLAEEGLLDPAWSCRICLAPDTAAGINRLAGASAAVLLVRSRTSSLKKIHRDYMLASRMNIPILGVIGIEGIS